MNENVYEHFRKDEHPFIDLVADWLERVEDQYSPYLTDFLDPRQAFIAETIIRQDSELQFSVYGGYTAAERQRMMIYPEYFTPTMQDYRIQVFEVVYPVKFGTLTHGKLLGTLLNAGLKRSYFGDIISDGERWQLFAEDHIANYLMTEVHKVGRLSVRLEKRNYTDILIPKDDWVLESTTAGSLRLDSMVSTVYNMSRQRAKQLIESGKVKLNWTVMQKPDFVLELLDIVSVRGYGRFQIREIAGKTKKEKHRLLLGVLRK